MRTSAKAVAPIVLTVLLALLPAPEGLAPHAWYFTAIFAGVVLALVLEPIPGALIGLVGVTAVALLSPWVLYAPEQLARPGFNPASASLSWALSGFANGTVWLIFAAFMFALGYDRSGLGRRIALLLVQRLGRRTLTLGYAVALADLALAPFTPSNTARSGGTIYPVIRNLPPLYGSKPNDPSARRIGSYVMWTAIAATCVTSSMFLTALAPNLLAVELAGRTAKVSISWFDWASAFAPAGILLLLAVPLLAFKLYPPEVTRGAEVADWAAGELRKMGGLSRKEVTLAVLVFATLVALAGGLAQVGFVAWFAAKMGGLVAGVPPTAALVALVVAFFLSHYVFASVTAHATALLPVFLTVGAAVPGMPMKALTLALCLTLGIMGIITPYATGPSPVYYGSGYLPSDDYWRLGAIFGAVYLAAMLLIGIPWLLLIT